MWTFETVKGADLLSSSLVKEEARWGMASQMEASLGQALG